MGRAGPGLGGGDERRKDGVEDARRGVDLVDGRLEVVRLRVSGRLRVQRGF
jgi:hypothetical protein